MTITSPFGRVDFTGNDEYKIDVIDSAYDDKEAEELRQELLDVYARFSNNESRDITPEAMRVLESALESIYARITDRSPLFKKSSQKSSERPF